MPPRTIIEKLWDAHVVHEQPGAPTLLYIDLHLVHEVTSPQAFQGLRERGLKVRRPDLTVATTDHSTPTTAPRPPTPPCRSSTRSPPNKSRSSKPTVAISGSGAMEGAAIGRGSCTLSVPNGIDAAQHDRSLRQQPHGHARGIRRAGLRHRHQRSRTRARHAMPPTAQIETVSGAGDRKS